MILHHRTKNTDMHTEHYRWMSKGKDRVIKVGERGKDMNKLSVCVLKQFIGCQNAFCIYKCKRKGLYSVAVSFQNYCYWVSLHTHTLLLTYVHILLPSHTSTPLLHLSGKQERLSREKGSPDRRCSEVCRPAWHRVVRNQCQRKHQRRRGERAYNNMS